MTPTTQSGMHPDAGSLTAFVEQQLPATERDQVLAHMANCSRCREVVFLAQRAAAEEIPEIAVVPAPTPPKGGRSWFASWHWTWVPIAAIAGLVGVAVVLHFRHPAPEMQIAKNGLQIDATRNTQALAPISSTDSERSLEEDKERGKVVPQRAISPPMSQKDASRRQDEKKIRQGIEATQLINEVSSNAGLSGGSSHGSVIARAKAPDIGGPMAANQFQQQNSVQTQSTLQATQSAANFDANKPVDKQVPATGSEVADEKVTVQAEPQETAPAPALPSRDLAMSTVTGRNLARLKKASKISLPGGVDALSIATLVGRTVALDTAGSLFFSDDNGNHWQEIPKQWTERAVLVRTRPVPAQIAGSLAVQAPRFELVNDKLQTWVSADGKTWTAQPIPSK